MFHLCFIYTNFTIINTITKIFQFIANIKTHFNLLRFYWKCFNIILPFSSQSLRKIQFVYCNKILTFNIKSINLIQNYPHIIESYACIQQIFVITLLFPMNFFNFFWNRLKSEPIKVCYIIIINIQSNLMCSY